MQLNEIQTRLAEQRLDGWLLYDFHRRNEIAYRVLALPDELIVTRRWYYFVPREGAPTGLVSALEAHNLDALPGEKIVYRTWQERHDALRSILPGGGTIAMEYSPMGAVPYVSLIDAGTAELIQSLDVQIASSADIVQSLLSSWSDKQWEDHLGASRRLMDIKEQAFAEVRRRIQSGAGCTDFEIQQYMASCYRDCGLVSDDPPIVATNANSSRPHYLPTASNSTEIHAGDVLLVDFWAKLHHPGAVYADYTWMAYVGDEVPSMVANVFSTVASARDAAITFVADSFARGEPIRGWQVDDAARDVIRTAGYGDYFIHRTGHNIDRDVHGEGANMDNYESHDDRVVLQRTCFSIEPGIYLPDFGVRSEVDVFITPDNRVEVTGPIQREVVALLA